MSQVPPVEVFPVRDVFADELALVEELADGCLRFTLTVTQRIGASTERVIVCRLIMPKSAVTVANATTAEILAKGVPAEPEGMSSELH